MINDVDILVRGITKEVAGKIEEQFGQRIVCLIHHGSSLFATKRDRPSDIDLELILDRREAGDEKKIREIGLGYKIPVGCQMRYLDEIVNPRGLIKKTGYKTFMYFTYANGETLLGRNIYKQLVNELKDQEVRDSLLISAQIALKEIRKKYLSGRDWPEIKKQMKVYLTDLLMYQGDIKYQLLGTKSVYDSGKDMFVGILSDAYPDLMQDIGAENLSELTQNNGNEVTMELVFEIAQKTYNYFFKK